ncbi:MAG: permease prefix domain 1-containing protein [Acutalibacteraceae bacterium]
MDELKKYTDSLFSHQRKDAQTLDLKEEILSNMIAMKNDLVSQGYSEDEAIKKVKGSLTDIGFLIDDNQLTDMNKYSVECSFSVLLSFTLFWILSIPLLFLGMTPICFIGFIGTVISGTIYIMRINQKRNEENVKLISVSSLKRRQTTVWAVWSVFYIVAALAVTAVTFGSNIWFGRPVHISGPHEFAQIAVRFYIPLLTIFIPLTVGRFTKVLAKCEKRSDNEK